MGDNDNLAAYTALVAQADTLIICSDIDGLYDADPRQNPNAKFIPRVDEIDHSIHQLAGGAGTSVGTGGMRTKIQAAEKCAKSGIQTLIVNGRNPEVFEQLALSRQPGTLFVPSKNRDSARTQWLRHTLRSKGTLVIDDGASIALANNGASLLPSGITSVLGSFKPGEAVDIRYKDQILAKGLCLYGNSELSQIKGQRSDKIETILGYSSGEVAVHRDDLVLL